MAHTNIEPKGLLEVELQETARQLFMRMPDLTVEQVARRMKLKTDLVRTWAERGQWVEMRSRLADMHRDKLAHVQKQLEKMGAASGYEVLHKSYKILNKTLGVYLRDDKMYEHGSVKTHSLLVNMIKNAVETEGKIRERLGIPDVPLNSNTLNQ